LSALANVVALVATRAILSFVPTGQVHTSTRCSSFLHRRGHAVSCKAEKPAGGTDDVGKFYQLGGDEANPEVVPGGFGPFGVIVGGWSDDELEYLVGPSLEQAVGETPGAAHVPIRVLARSDMNKPLGEVLDSIAGMDSVMPAEGDDARLSRPLLLFSGWPPERMIQAVRKFRNMVALRQVEREPLAAMAVPRAVRKPMRYGYFRPQQVVQEFFHQQQLVDEIEGDFDANQGS